MTGTAGTPFERFRRLHEDELPLLLPNAWDHASAALLAERGFAAVGTTSLGVAAAAGLPDGTGATRELTLALGRALARLPVPVTVDIEGGFSQDPAEVAALGAELADAGVAGVNIEDGRADGTLTPVERQCALVGALKRAAPGLFVNARTDTHWLPGADRAATADRLRAYREAGADGVFVPGLRDEETIARLVREAGVPLNILYVPGGPAYRRLAELGVARVSCGSLLYRAALHTAAELARSIAGPPDEPPDVPSYGETQALARAFAPE
jgi:2-methylisocitrate lyase-like PEP mutase family enzyme